MSRMSCESKLRLRPDEGKQFQFSMVFITAWNPKPYINLSHISPQQVASSYEHLLCRIPSVAADVSRRILLGQGRDIGAD